MKEGWAKGVMIWLFGVLVGAAGVMYQLNARVIRLETEMVNVKQIPDKLDRLDKSIVGLNLNIELLRQRIDYLDGKK